MISFRYLISSAAVYISVCLWVKERDRDRERSQRELFILILLDHFSIDCSGSDDRSYPDPCSPKKGLEYIYASMRNLKLCSKLWSAAWHFRQLGWETVLTSRKSVKGLSPKPQSVGFYQTVKHRLCTCHPCKNLSRTTQVWLLRSGQRSCIACFVVRKRTHVRHMAAWWQVCNLQALWMVLLVPICKI